MKKKWYDIKAKAMAANAPIEVMIYDEIGGWGISAAQLVADFKAIDDGVSQVVVAINSPGGDVFDGFALNGWIQRLGARAMVRIDGVAASAASVIACGGETVVMAESAMMMIHNPWTYAVGSADDLRKTADMMDKTRDGILAAYRRKAPAIDDAEMIRMLDEETWLTAAEAVALGLADAVGDAAPIRASCGRSGLMARFKNVPKALISEADQEGAGAEQSKSGTEPPKFVAAGLPPDPAQIAARSAARIAKACLNAGIPNLAEDLIMKTALADESAVSAEIGRVGAIRDLCVAARLPELAAEYVKSGLPAEAVRARLFDKIVAAGGDEISNKKSENGSGEAQKAKALNPTAIYAARNGRQSGKAVKTNPSKGPKA